MGGSSVSSLSIDGWIYLAILNLAEHRGGDTGGRGEFADRIFLFQT